MKIEPMPGTVLVELAVSDYGDIPLEQKAYDSVTMGKILGVHPDDKEKWGYLVGRTGFWSKFKDDSRVLGVDKKLSLIEIKDIKGTAYEHTNT